MLAWVLGWVLGVPPFKQIDLSLRSVLWGMIATLPPLLALWWSLRSGWRPLTRLLRDVDEMFVTLFRGCTYVELTLISLLAGVGEEALFRGVIQMGLADRLNPLTGLVVASALFGVAHLVTRTYAVLAGLIGLYLGALLLLSGNLLVPIIVHALYDTVALIYLVRRHGAGAEATSS